jgi:hypothetical protein
MDNINELMGITIEDDSEIISCDELASLWNHDAPSKDDQLERDE